ncbi:terpene synthase [Ceratobasidium sp. AG-Ba]|nr:terpene synthase [Ceratobasidium sp. AG-Ba]
MAIVAGNNMNSTRKAGRERLVLFHRPIHNAYGLTLQKFICDRPFAARVAFSYILLHTSSNFSSRTSSTLKYFSNMPGYPKLKLIDRSAFPPKIVLPDVAGYTGQFFDVKLNPNWKEAEAGSYAGVHHGRKRQEFFDTGFGQMASLAYPDADLEHLRPSMDFILWLFAFDDMIDEGGLRDNVDGTKLAVDITMDVLRNPDTAQPKFKIAASLLSFFQRMRANSSPATIKRFVDASDLYTQAILQQTVNRSVDDVPTVEEFIELRRDTSAVKMVFAVLEYSLGLSLPEEVHNDPIIAELSLCGNDILTWANDVYSFPIEQARGDTQNLVFITMWDKQLDLEGAMEYVDQLTRRRTQDYVEAKKKLRSFGPELDAQIQLYIQGIEYWVQGSIDWTFMTPRYFGAEVENVRDTGVVDIMAPIAPSAPIVVDV